MATGIKTLVALDAEVDVSLITGALPSHDPTIEIVGVVEGLQESWRTVEETQTDLLVVGCAGYSDRALFFIEGAVKARPERPVVAIAGGSPNGFVRRVFEAGADDFIALPETPEKVAFALHKVVARRQGAAVASGSSLAPMVVVLGPKGGTGKTLVASNLAVALANRGRRTVLVDLDLQFGDVGLTLGLSPEKTVYDVAKSGGSLDAEKLEAFLVRHPSGLRVLMAPTRPDQASFVSVEFLRDVYATLRASNDFVVVDTPPGFTPEVIASIDSSSNVCLVGMLDSLSLKNTKLGFETLDLMGYDRSKVCVVLNRADSRIGISTEDVQAILGRAPDVLVPSDREITRSVTAGTPIVLAHERSEAAKSFRALADVYLPLREALLTVPAPEPSDNGSTPAKPATTARRLLARRR